MEQTKNPSYQELIESGKLIPQKPMQNKVIVLPDPPEDRTEGGLYIPDTAKKRANKGTVVGAGPGTKEFETLCKPGDRILFAGGSEFEFEGVTYLRLSAVTDVISIL